MRRKYLVLPVVFLLSAVCLPLDAQQHGILTNSLGMKMVRVEPGTFKMGSFVSRDLWYEQPVHDVMISQPFYISETEVTVEQFRQSKPDFEGTAAHRPYVAGVSWDDARAFTEWLSKKEGKPYRLPTEAEWEYVARSGSDGSQSQAKGQLDKPNAWGVKNMLAGPREWCLDWFGEYSSAKQTDPVGPESGNVKVVRGGALDLEERNRGEIDFSRPQARLAMPPSFGRYGNSLEKNDLTTGERPGLIGVWYRRTDFTEPRRPTLLHG
jgi:formylglycine-generating enzyme required for sulfatase activity